jgi:hypothetical protein
VAEEPKTRVTPVRSEQQRLHTAISGLVLVIQPDVWTWVTLPAANTYDWNRLGPTGSNGALLRLSALLWRLDVDHKVVA